ncbi:hypothetical protein ACLOJK_011552 [Asimina triloba]
MSQRNCVCWQKLVYAASTWCGEPATPSTIIERCSIVCRGRKGAKKAASLGEDAQSIKLAIEYVFPRHMINQRTRADVIIYMRIRLQ